MPALLTLRLTQTESVHDWRLSKAVFAATEIRWVWVLIPWLKRAATYVAARP